MSKQGPFSSLNASSMSRTESPQIAEIAWTPPVKL
jgi:hypothetical protein